MTHSKEHCTRVSCKAIQKYFTSARLIELIGSKFMADTSLRIRRNGAAPLCLRILRVQSREILETPQGDIDPKTLCLGGSIRREPSTSHLASTGVSRHELERKTRRGTICVGMFSMGLLKLMEIDEARLKHNQRFIHYLEKAGHSTRAEFRVHQNTVDRICRTR